MLVRMSGETPKFTRIVCLGDSMHVSELLILGVLWKNKKKKNAGGGFGKEEEEEEEEREKGKKYGRVRRQKKIRTKI
jgi:hypothetical protein